MTHKHTVTIASIPSALALLTIALPAPAADRNDNSRQKDEMPKVTIEAAHEVQKRRVGTSYTGIPIEEVSLTRHVGVSDLDLSTPTGRAELDKRIKEVAKEACKQLETLYPLEDWVTDRDTCIADAVKGAKAQEQQLLAAYQKK
jgi:UrcA family protein